MEHWLWIILAALFFGKIETTTCLDSFLKIDGNWSSEQKSLNSWAVSVHRVTLYTWYLTLSSPLSLINNVSLMASFSPLCPGLIAGDTISPEGDEVSGREGESVTLRCKYQSGSSNPYLYWYKHHSDLHAPQFILWKASTGTSEYIPDKRYESKTSSSSTELTINKLTLEDTALYYCAVETQWYKV